MGEYEAKDDSGNLLTATVFAHIIYTPSLMSP